MELVSHRVLELLQDQRKSQTLRVTAVFRQNSFGRVVRGNYPCAADAPLAKYLDLVPVYPCDGIPGNDCARRPFIIEVNGVSFFPKFEVVTSVVQTWMEEFMDGVHGSLNMGARCELSGEVGGRVIYTKRVMIDVSGNAAKVKKNVNRVAQEVMRVKALGQNMVFTAPGPTQRTLM